MQRSLIKAHALSVPCSFARRSTASSDPRIGANSGSLEHGRPRNQSFEPRMAPMTRIRGQKPQTALIRVIGVIRGFLLAAGSRGQPRFANAKSMESLKILG